MQYSVKLLVAALLALSPAAHPALREFALAQVAQSPAFSLPETVPSGTTLSIQSSPNLGFAAEALKQEFEAAYEGTEVGVEVTNSDEAIAALIDGDVDLAAIGRPLTEEEQAQGLNTVALERAKIAIIVGPDNPFEGNLTFAQFAAMFRGEITDWSEVGGEPGPIRFVDRPADSDTRRSLSQYEVFTSAPFEAGPNTETVAEDDTADVIQALNDDGIGYAIAPHVIDQPAVAIVPMHQTLPDDPRYPYSQPRYFVYSGEPSPAVAAFLGYATSPEGLAAFTAAQVAEVGDVAEGVTAPADPVAEDTPAAAPADAEADPEAVAPVPDETAPVVADNDGGFAWWWLLLPLAALGGLAWLLGRGR
ncbi:phosphate ABC transporter substrate-binding protein, partial [filamentous cyanobacterium CCP3]